MKKVRATKYLAMAQFVSYLSSQQWRGRWVALVLADNDCHMKAAGDDELLRRSLRLIQAQLTLLELYDHPALDDSSEAAKTMKALKKRLEE